MRSGAAIAVIIPAYNEEPSIGKVVSSIPQWVDDIIVADNGSTDGTAEVARSHGARVVFEPERGYGAACLAAMASLDEPDIVVFLDGDFSDYPEEMHLLVDPIVTDETDVVIGSRILGKRESGALTPQARFGNWLSCMLIRWLWQITYTDLGPFRAVRHKTLKALAMRDRNYGWTVELQIKAARDKVRIREVPVSYRRRIGKSKVSGTVKGVIGAGVKILYTIFLAAVGLLPGEIQEEPRERLILFTRYPMPGKTKSRLIPALGPDGAADLQCLMTERVLHRARQIERQRRVLIEVRYEGGNSRLIRQWLGRGLCYLRQGRGDLGERMARAFREAFADGAERVVLVGTDCPGVTADVFQKAFDSLADNDVVFGPATDGGYYLIGMRRFVPRLFVDMEWGSASVLQETIRVLDELKLTMVLVDKLDDIDRPEDLHVWEQANRTSPIFSADPKISIIIPTFNEASVVGSAIGSARTSSGIEIIVVDGGSTDGTIELVKSKDVKVIESKRCRAHQMNVGAAAGTGDVMLFLHADTRLPAGFKYHVVQALAHPGTVAGAFEIGIDGQGRGLHAIERAVNWRSRHLGLPYGDQALFLKTELFHEMGGLPNIPIMEDFEFVRRLRSQGRVAIVPSRVITSGRRWLDLGIVRTTLLNQAVVIAYYLGVSPTRIARWYHRDQESE